MSDAPHALLIREAITNELAGTDYTQLPDSPFSNEVKQQWRLYRQALRDLSKMPDTATMARQWPTSPLGKNLAVDLGWRDP